MFEVVAVHSMIQRLPINYFICSSVWFRHLQNDNDDEDFDDCKLR